MSRPRRRRAFLLILALVATPIGLADVSAGEKSPPQMLLGKKLVFSDDFESASVDRWQPTDKAAWKVIAQGENHILNLFKKNSDYKPPVRSPLNRSLIKDLNVGSFVLDVKLQSTTPDYGHRDMCLFFGYQDDSHLYYVHLGKKMDPHANNIFIVNGEPRKSISIKTTAGTNWDDEWHHARVVRNVASGTIEVFFDDMKSPVMTAKDETFKWGRVGVGTFDDTGNFDDVLVYGDVVAPAKK